MQISNELLEEIKMPSSYFQVLMQKLRYEDWSAGIRMGIEVLVVAIGVVSVSVFVPWAKLLEIRIPGTRQVIITEISNEMRATPEIETLSKKEDETQSFPDENTTKASPAIVIAKATSVPPVKTEITPPKLQAPIRQGYLYRGSIKVTNLDATIPKFIEKITELGGRKAGAVDLGWKKGSTGYFHLTMPEAKEQAFLGFSKDYGSLVLVKEKHDRVMSEGIIRIIFIIEEKK
jgi:hypothetical protein